MLGGGLALLALAACADEPPPPSIAVKPSLAQACTVRPCQCLSTSGAIFLIRKSAPIRWLKNGDASCPEGFELTLSDEK